MEKKRWTLEDFKQYARQCIDAYYWDSPSRIVLRSFYIAEVEKPKDVTIRLFTWLRAVAEKEIQTYKSVTP